MLAGEEVLRRRNAVGRKQKGGTAGGAKDANALRGHFHLVFTTAAGAVDLSVRLQHTFIPTEHTDAGADSGLSQVHRSNIGALQLLQSWAHFAVEGIDKFSTGYIASINITLAADKHDGR